MSKEVNYGFILTYSFHMASGNYKNIYLIMFIIILWWKQNQIVNVMVLNLMSVIKYNKIT